MKALLTAILALALIPFTAFAADDAKKDEMMDKDGKKMEHHEGHHKDHKGHDNDKDHKEEHKK